MGNPVNFLGMSERWYHRSIVEQKNTFYSLPDAEIFEPGIHPGKSLDDLIDFTMPTEWAIFLFIAPGHLLAQSRFRGPRSGIIYKRYQLL
jgi:hypothetical protein